jgi:hypothetical protein
MTDKSRAPASSSPYDSFARHAAMAHEINNLMMVVIANIELASLQPSSERQRKQLLRAVWAAGLAGRLTREPFFTKKGPGHGTGLGLAVVSTFVAQVGGTLKVDTIPGKGTTVRLWFPQMDSSSPNEARVTTAT